MLILLVGCVAAVSVSTPPAKADPPLAAPVTEWVSDSSWSCSVSATDEGSRYDIVTSWTFTDESWSTDLWQVLADGMNSGAFPISQGLPLSGWIVSDGTSYAPSSLFATPFGGTWLGVTDSSVLLSAQGANGLFGYGALWKFTRYTASDGTLRAEFASPAQILSFVIDCAQDS